MVERFLKLAVHRSLDPEVAGRQLAESLEAGCVPTRMLYVNPRQTRQWQTLATIYSPAHRALDGAVAYERIHSRVATALAGADSVQIVGLGCGDGNKEALLAAQFPSLRNLTFVPVDASLPLIQIAARVGRARQGTGSARPVLADLEFLSRDLVKAIPRGNSARRVVTLYGVLPWMGSEKALNLARNLLEPGDLLCLSAYLYPDSDWAGTALTEQYDNPDTRRWIEMMLEDLGLGDFSGNLAIETAPDLIDGTDWTVIGSLTLFDGARVQTGKRMVELPEGSSLRVFKSARHSVDLLERIVTRAGLNVHELEVSPSGEEGVVLAGL